MDEANGKTGKGFTVEYSSSHIYTFDSGEPPARGELNWKLLNNDDDYYSAENIHYCPYCGKGLGE